MGYANSGLLAQRKFVSATCNAHYSYAAQVCFIIQILEALTQRKFVSSGCHAHSNTELFLDQSISATPTLTLTNAHNLEARLAPTY